MAGVSDRVAPEKCTPLHFRHFDYKKAKKYTKGGIVE